MAATGQDAPVTTVRDGVRYTKWVVTEDVTTTTTDEWFIGVPEFGEITLVESDLLGAGSANTLQTAFGYAAGAGWVVGGVGHIDQVSTPAANVRLDASKRFTTRTGDSRIYIRPTPDVNLDGTQSIEHHITVAWGHRP